jgi:hypothetical protein
VFTNLNKSSRRKNLRLRWQAGLFLVFVLDACTSLVGVPDKHVAEPKQPGLETIRAAARRGAFDEKLSGPIEVSELRKVERGGGDLFVCIRTTTNPRSTYVVVFADGAFSFVRQSAITENCGQQQYSPL